MNSTSVENGAYDMGEDGKLGSPNRLVARNAYGFSLNYFSNEYTPVNDNYAPFTAVSVGANLFNGNIKAMAVNIPKLGEPLVYGYGYHQLNRLVSMDAYGGVDNKANIFTPVQLKEYRERVVYDANGNIKNYLRHGDAARMSMDDLGYIYKPGTNQLDKVEDATLDVAATEYDKYKDNKQDQEDGNYGYGPIGNLTTDVSEGITGLNGTGISWTVYGKIAGVVKERDKVVTSISYSYDAAGNRISN